MTETDLYIRLNKDVVTLVNYALYKDVSLIEESDNELVISLTNLNNSKAFIDLTLKINKSLVEGSYEYIEIDSDDIIAESLENIVIYPMGDVNGDSTVNTRDVGLLKQFVVGKTELSEGQMIMADVYKTGSTDDNVVISTRDVALLQQYIVGLISSFN